MLSAPLHSSLWLWLLGKFVHYPAQEILHIYVDANSDRSILGGAMYFAYEFPLADPN